MESLAFLSLKRGLKSVFCNAHFSVSAYEKLYQEGSYEGQDSIELRQSSINHGVGLHIVTLRNTDDTVGTNLTLTDGREKANQSDTDTYTTPQQRIFCHLLKCRKKARKP